MTYLKRFEAALNTKLGGWDMAKAFFKRHPDMVREARISALYHLAKGGAYWKGAAIFFKQRVRPVLKADRTAACKTPIK